MENARYCRSRRKRARIVKEAMLAYWSKDDKKMPDITRP